MPSPCEPLTEAFSEPSREPSCEEKGPSGASFKPTDNNFFHVKVHMKLRMKFFLHMKVHVKAQMKVHQEALPNGTHCFNDLVAGH